MMYEADFVAFRPYLMSFALNFVIDHADIIEDHL